MVIRVLDKDLGDAGLNPNSATEGQRMILGHLHSLSLISSLDCCKDEMENRMV